MAKHTQSIRRLLPTNCLGVFDHFLGVGAERVNIIFYSNLLLKTIFVQKLGENDSKQCRQMSRSIVVCGILNIKFQPYYNLEILKVKVISKLF